MEALERRRIASLLFFLCTFCSSIEGQRNSTRMSYVCPPMFIRLGHSCYFFSENKASWQNALFACKYWAEKKCALKKLCAQQNESMRRTGGGPADNLPMLSALDMRLVAVMGGQEFALGDSQVAVDPFPQLDRDSSLSVPARWEDRNLRKYLNKPNVEKESRWIGGIYDQGSRGWRWGGELRRMHYQSFSKMKKMTPEELQFHCIAMMPELLYRWAPRNCIEPRQYICQTKLRKVPKAKVKDLRRRWQRMGKINEITAPSVSREVNDPMINDVTTNPVLNPKSFDLQANRLIPQKRGRNQNPRNNPKNYNLRPNELRKRSRPVNSRLTRPFPGYTWNRRDPEGSFERNAALLRAGRTGLSAAQVKAHLARLRRLRDKQLARRRRLRERGDWLVNERQPEQALANTRARTYTVDNNISALHPRTIVEEFDMFPQPIAVRPARGAG